MSAPTVSSIFGAQPTILADPIQRPVDPANLPATNSTVIAQATITALDAHKLREVVVYKDSLSSNWSLEHSSQIKVDVANKVGVYQGRSSIKAQLQYAVGSLYFTLNKTATETLPRERVQAVRFYLSGGSDSISNDVLAVAVVGSNRYPYWVEDDRSVQIEGRVTDGQPIFSETRLVFLGIKTAIPRKTYIEVTVWLNSLLYDPSYKYVTGFYLKTEKAKVPIFYVDGVSFLLTPDKK